MSDKFYAVQFRSMHTAIHSVAVFSLEEKAQELLMFLEEEERMPEEVEMPFEPSNFIAMYEINFRNVPYHWPDIDDPDAMPLIYVNGEGTLNPIPDVYGY